VLEGRVDAKTFSTLRDFSADVSLYSTLKRQAKQGNAEAKEQMESILAELRVKNHNPRT